MNDFGTVPSTCVSFEAAVESQDMLVELYALLGKRLIFVPREPSICPGFHQPDEPELYLDEHIEMDKGHVVAGLGVVAGEESYKKLNDGNTVLMWE